MKKIGLVGAGGYAKEHLTNLLARHAKKELEFCGVVIRPQDRPDVRPSIEMLENAGIPIYEDTESMYENARPDVVVLPVAIGAHCPLALDAVNRGINVMVEKPAAGSLAEVDRMIEAEKETGKFIAVGFQHIYATDVQQLKQQLLDGQFGQLRKIAVMGRWPRSDVYYQRNDWVCKEHGPHGEPIFDSPINNAFAHYLNLALFFAGKSFEKSTHATDMQAELYRARRNIETFDTCGVRLKTTSDVEILCLLTHACDANVNPKLRLECDKATITWSEATSWQARMKDNQLVSSQIVPCNGRTALLDTLMERAQGKEIFTCTLDIAKEHTFVIENLHKHFAVSNIPQDNFSINPQNGQYAINDIADVFDRGFDTCKLPSELGATWAKQTNTIRNL